MGVYLDIIFKLFWSRFHYLNHFGKFATKRIMEWQLKLKREDLEDYLRVEFIWQLRPLQLPFSRVLHTNGPRNSLTHSRSHSHAYTHTHTHSGMNEHICVCDRMQYLCNSYSWYSQGCAKVFGERSEFSSSHLSKAYG